MIKKFIKEKLKTYRKWSHKCEVDFKKKQGIYPKPEPGERPQCLDAPLYEDKKGKWIMSIELISGSTYTFRLETKEEMRSIKRAILKDIEGNNSKSLAFKNTISLIDKILSIDFKEE